MTSDLRDSNNQGNAVPDQNGKMDPLAAFFNAAQATAPRVSGALRARLLADADQSKPSRVVQPGPVLRLRSWLSNWTGPGLAGGATATLAGFWIGLTMPMPVLALDAPLWMLEALSYMDMVTMPLLPALDDPLVVGF